MSATVISQLICDSHSCAASCLVLSDWTVARGVLCFRRHRQLVMMDETAAKTDTHPFGQGQLCPFSWLIHGPPGTVTRAHWICFLLKTWSKLDDMALWKLNIAVNRMHSWHVKSLKNVQQICTLDRWLSVSPASGKPLGGPAYIPVLSGCLYAWLNSSHEYLISWGYLVASQEHHNYTDVNQKSLEHEQTGYFQWRFGVRGERIAPALKQWSVLNWYSTVCGSILYSEHISL